MNPGDELASPATDDPALPSRPTEAGSPRSPSAPAPATAPGAPATDRPTPEAVLRWIAAADGAPWFPSAHALNTGTPRDSLDEPLNDLRAAGLVRVEAWIRGAGQGYVLTKEGAAAAVGGGSPPAPAEEERVELFAGDAGASDQNLRPPVVTPALLLANLIWFGVGVVVSLRLGVPLGSYAVRGDAGVLERLGAVSAADLLRGEWWRLLTCAFVHFGVIHLAVNMVALGTAGPLAEELWGRRRFAAVYALSALAGSCLLMAVSPANEETGAPVIAAGASAAVWGVMTSLLAWLLLFRDQIEPGMAADGFRRLGFVLVLNAGVNLLPGVGWQGHLGGGVAGFVAAGLLNAVRAGGPRAVVAAGLLLVLPIACVGGLGLAMKQSDEWAAFRKRAATRPALTDPEVGPLLEATRPELVKPVEREAVFLLVRSPGRRSAESKERVRAKVVQLREAAAALANRGRAVPYADARMKSLSMLLGMIDADAIPDVPTWRAWGDSRREAEKLWAAALGR